MIKFFIFYFLFVCSQAFSLSREEVKSYLDHLQNTKSVPERLDKYSSLFLNKPYGQGGPLGEGSEGDFDQDPLYRFDQFDCTTYLETVMALALSESVDEFELILARIRFENGEIEYLKRNHFTDLQWIPNNIKEGFLEDITQEISTPQYLKIARALIDFPNWILHHKIDQLRLPGATESIKREMLHRLHSRASLFKKEVAEVMYIEVSSILKMPSLLKNLPHGSIVNFVRPNWDLTQEAGTHQNISHQGFLFWKKGSLWMRHASTSNGGSVQEIMFIDYLKKFENHPTLKGIHLMKVVPDSV